MTENITHHPDPVTLIDYASGALTPSLAAVVATHLLLCQQCRKGIKALEMAGGVMLGPDAERGGALAPLKLAMAKTEAQKPVSGESGFLPRAAIEAFGLSGGIAWNYLGLGVRHCRIPTGRHGGDLRLMRIAANVAVPQHSHGGTELTLVLSGAFRDETGTYRRGDVQDVDGDIEHQPRVTPDAECVCLVASISPARFTTLVGRLSQLWTGM